jgi:hypothetical protein
MLSTNEQFKIFQGAQALGEMAIASEYLMIPEGFEDMQFLIKSFPLPITNPEDVIEVPMIGGQTSFTPQIAKTMFKGGISLKETVHGHAKKFLEAIAAERTVDKRSYFNFTIYQGTVAHHTNVWHCKKATIFGMEPLEVDFENRGVLATYTGQIAYHYFPNVA